MNKDDLLQRRDELLSDLADVQKQLELLNTDCRHEYPQDWQCTAPPCCLRCGKMAPYPYATCGLVHSNPELIITCEPTRTDV